MNTCEEEKLSIFLVMVLREYLEGRGIKRK
jgi:hypothetical protein